MKSVELLRSHQCIWVFLYDLRTAIGHKRPGICFSTRSDGNSIGCSWIERIFWHNDDGVSRIKNPASSILRAAVGIDVIGLINYTVFECRATLS